MKTIDRLKNIFTGKAGEELTSSLDPDRRKALCASTMEGVSLDFVRGGNIGATADADLMHQLHQLGQRSLALIDTTPEQDQPHY